MFRLTKQMVVGFCFLLCVGVSVEEPDFENYFHNNLQIPTTGYSTAHEKPRTSEQNYADADKRSERMQLGTSVARKSDDFPVRATDLTQQYKIEQHTGEPEYDAARNPNQKNILIKAGSPSVMVTMNVIHGLIRSNNVTLECFIDSFPKATNFWMNAEGERLKSNSKYNITEIPISHYVYRDRLRLQILDFDFSDYTLFRCVSSNQFGAKTGIIRVTAQEYIRTHAFPSKGTIAIERGTDFMLACHVDAFPIAVTYWLKLVPGEAAQIINNDKYKITEEHLSQTKFYSRLRIKNFTADEHGAYRCVTKNSHGERSHTFYLSSDYINKKLVQVDSSKDTNGSSEGRSIHSRTRLSYWHRILFLFQIILIM